MACHFTNSLFQIAHQIVYQHWKGRGEKVSVVEVTLVRSYAEYAYLTILVFLYICFTPSSNAND